MSNIKIFESKTELNRFAAEKFVEIGNSAISENGRFTVALAGGSTPKGLYQLLTTKEFSDKIDWTRIYFFFGDERNVPHDSDESNYKMAGKNLLNPLKISEDQIFAWRTNLENPEKIAENYNKTIKNFFDLNEKELPHFDLILLGMGDDGHTASLFPDTKALDESEKIAVENWVEKFDSFRLTFTFPTINNAANVLFLVVGEKKAETLRVVLNDENNEKKMPSQNVKPKDGKLFWLVDADAAKFLA